jgi:hypothetical protein
VLEFLGTPGGIRTRDTRIRSTSHITKTHRDTNSHILTFLLDFNGLIKLLCCHT